MGAFEVPVAGISISGQVYVAVSTNHSENRWTDRSVLTRFTLPANFQPLRTISQLPDGHFVKMSLHIESATIAGLPPGGPFVFVWGTGPYRKSDAYLSIVPASQFENGKGTRYFAGLDSGGCSDLEREGIGRSGHRPKRHEGRCFGNVVQGSWLVVDDLRQSRPSAAWHLVLVFPHTVGAVERAANHFQRNS